MADVSRRNFLMRSSLVAAAAGALSSVPGLAGLLATGSSEAPALDSAPAEVDAAGLGGSGAAGPVVAHVRDVATGEIGILNGTREVVIRDPRLVAQLIHASK